MLCGAATRHWMHKEVYPPMTQHTELEQELDRRLTDIESNEIDDPVHAALSGRSIIVFVAVALGIAAVSWIVAAL